MKFLLSFTLFISISFLANANPLPLNDFKTLYERQYADISKCPVERLSNRVALCSSAFKNEASSPFILHNNKKTEKVVVLFHGLSDTPFYLSSIAAHLHGMGINVIIPLLPAHGLIDANDIMQSKELSDHWQTHVAEIMALAAQFGEHVFIGGFSTGGALATHYTLDNPDQIKGLLLFSGALSLAGNAESLAKIWGIQILARFMDGEYETYGPNPYKYPKVSSSAAMELMEVIFSIREKMKQDIPLSLPIYVAHSQADATTPIDGVENLLAYNQGVNTALVINAKHDVCHADVVLNHLQLSKMKIDKNAVEALDKCALPSANPLFEQMTRLLTTYFATVN